MTLRPRQTNRETILRGTAAATRLARDLNLREQLTKRPSGIDVFGIIGKLGIELIFRPLDAQGFCIREPVAGVLITTNRPLSVQRFTAAHELGHLMMQHEFLGSSGMMFRSDTKESIGNGNRIFSDIAFRNVHDRQELEAETFASEFLLPKWLLLSHARQQQWCQNDFAKPEIVYQASLRLGASYRAVCWALARHGVHELAVAQKLAAINPKDIKQKLLGKIKPDDFWRDVWCLREHDHGLPIAAGPDDIFVLELKERGTSGYLWDVEKLRAEGFDLIGHSGVLEGDPEAVGGSVLRHWTLGVPADANRDINLKERRPWSPNQELNHFSFHLTSFGKEKGLPRFRRPLNVVAGNTT